MIRLLRLTLPLAAGFAAGTALAQEATTFDIDRDADGRSSYESFNAAFDSTGLFDRFDANRDGLLSRDELNHGVFVIYDADADDYLTGEEAERLIDEWDGPVRAGLHGVEPDAGDPDPVESN